MDRIIKPGTGADENPLRLHSFSTINKAGSTPGVTPSSSACESFQSGLIRQESNCPTLSGLDAMLSKKRSEAHRISTDADHPESDHTDTVDEQQTESCILKRLSEGLQKFEKERNRIYERAAQETVKLALAISKKVINHEVSVNPEVVLGMVRKAMQKIKDSQTICIRVHPQGLETMKQMEFKPTGKGTSYESYKIEADDTLAPGDCLVETRQENIDASIHRQLAVIEEAFMSLGHIPQND